MTSLLSSIRTAFWTDSIWLPENITWDTYKNKQHGIEYAQFDDLYYSLITAVVLLVIRFNLERWLYTPIGILLGLKPRRKYQAPDVEFLELEYRKNWSPSSDELQALSKRCDWSERQLQRWFRLRSKQNKPTTLTKFTECAWRMTFYTCSFSYGLYALYDKKWTWDSIHGFQDYPHHSVSGEVWWLYNIELGFYLSLIVSQFFDIKRKDFWQMFIHHIVTVLLLSLSWTCQFHRIGTFVLVIHDFADIPLEGAKLARYLKYQTLSNVIFAIFTVSWIFSRIGLLPYRVIAYTSYYALFIIKIFPVYYIFNCLLCLLQLLHIIWTWLILKVAYEAIFKDGVKDIRESEESSSETGEDDFPAKDSAIRQNGYKETHLKNGNNNEFDLRGRK